MADTKSERLGLLLRCYDAVRNWHALVMLAVAFVVALLLAAAAAAIGARMAFEGNQFAAILLGGPLELLAALVMLAGINGAGLMMVDQADQVPARSFGAAFFGGLGVTLQAVVCLIILGIGLGLVVLVLWALSFLSHIPGIGGLFGFILAGPSVLVLAFCYAVLVFGVSLMFVALWRGQGIIGAIGRAIDIVLKRPLDTVLHFIVLALLIFPIALLVVAVMAGGTFLVAAMYASGDLLGGGMAGMMGGYGGSVLGSLGSSGNAGAAISIVIVFATVYALFVLIQMLGTVLIYDSLDAETATGAADVLRKTASTVKAKVEENRPHAPMRPADEVRTAPVAAADTARKCGHCGSVLVAGDRFCGECGHPA